ncbi:hypothetical protein BDN70DRAFT_932164 [Pholiota conissans]|uniref:F-box domain-containing protein n=1 Tax=Pholiota conissans TaxID=109636 RepID=A0A9P5Z209_9AGAR|nr:hypothetical protein BDN70DRAFT_932164 [Pholiota conissans]
MAYIDSLPTELLLKIASYGCSSQKMYLSLVLVSKRYYAVAKYYGLRNTPIRISSHSLRSFYEFVTTHGMGKYVGYLWINSTSALCSQAVKACTNLVCLACSKVVLYSLCAPLPTDHDGFQHTKLTELTIFDNWESWHTLQQPSHIYALQLFRQITHLRLHGFISSFLQVDMFPALTHYSCSYQNADLMADQVASVASLPRLQSIAITTYYWKNEPMDARTESLLLMDKRIKFVFLGPNELGEFTLWCGRARKTACFWTVEAKPRKVL